MKIEDLFLYDKIRSCYLAIKRQSGLRNKDVDILLYCRYFCDTDGWASYPALREYVIYVIAKRKSQLFKRIVLELVSMGFLEIRERKGNFNTKMKKLQQEVEEEKGERNGYKIQLRLTQKGLLYIAEFDTVAEKYLNETIVNKEMRATGIAPARQAIYKTKKKLQEDGW